jgi:PAS domain S-box-containing protein
VGRRRGHNCGETATGGLRVERERREGRAPTRNSPAGGVARVRNAWSLIPVFFLVCGGLLHALAQIGNHLGFVPDLTQDTLRVVSLCLVFTPALYALRKSLNRPIVRRLAISGVTFELFHLALDVADDSPLLNAFWFFDNSNAVHIVAQEASGAAAVTLLLGSLYYFVVSHQASESAYALERDRLKAQVNERLQAEAALQEEKRLTTAILDSLPGVVYFLDESAQLLRWNKNAEQVSGYASLEMARMKAQDFFVEEDREAVLESLKEVLARGYSSLEARLVYKNGTVAPYFFTGSNVRIGGKWYIIGTGTDISQRVSAEESLRRHSEALKQATDGVVIADLKGTIQFANPAWARMHGFEPRDFEGEHARVFHTPEQMANEVEPFAEVLRAKGSHSGQVGHVRRDGTVFQTWMSASLVRNDRGAPASIVSIARDITEERELEGQLRHAQKMEAIGTLAGGIAHNLRNNLGSVLGWIEIAESNPHDGDTLRTSLERATRSGRKAADHVKRLLTFSRATEGIREPVRVADVVAEGLQLLRGMLPSTITLRQTIDSDCGLVLADADQIHQILINLGTNALDVMREEGGVLTVALAETEVGPEQAGLFVNMKPGRHVRLEVSDTGAGMSQETLDQIFDPFFTTKEPGAGTGLGLSVVHGIVENLRGVIDVASGPGGGTVFTVFLPACPTGSMETLAKPVTPRDLADTIQRSVPSQSNRQS